MAAAARRFDDDDEHSGVVWYVQVNWKRRKGVATRYELELAIERLLCEDKIEISDGILRLSRAKRPTFEPISKAEQWRREDEALRAFCEEMAVHETRSAVARDAEKCFDQESMFYAQVLRAAPRRGIERYVLRELAKAGPMGYAEIIDAIFDSGGWEREREEPRKVEPRPRASARKATRHG